MIPKMKRLESLNMNLNTNKSAKISKKLSESTHVRIVKELEK